MSHAHKYFVLLYLLNACYSEARHSIRHSSAETHAHCDAQAVCHNLRESPTTSGSQYLVPVATCQPLKACQAACRRHLSSSWTACEALQCCYDQMLSITPLKQQPAITPLSCPVVGVPTICRKGQVSADGELGSPTQPSCQLCRRQNSVRDPSVKLQ